MGFKLLGKWSRVPKGWDPMYTYFHTATGTFTAIDLFLCSPSIRMEIMAESDSYGSDHFPIVKKLTFHFLIHYPAGISIGLTGCNLIIYVKKNDIGCNRIV